MEPLTDKTDLVVPLGLEAGDAAPLAAEPPTVYTGDFAVHPTSEKARQLRANVRVGLLRGEELITAAVSIPGNEFGWEKLSEALYAAKALQAVLISSLESLYELSDFAPWIEQQIARARDFLDG